MTAIDPIESSQARAPRRSVLTAALGGVAALVAAAIGRPGTTRAAAGSPVLQGQNNNAGATVTTVTSSIAANSAIVGTNSNSTGRGVHGRSTATTGGSYGVYGTSASSGGRAIYGKATATSGTTNGVRGEVTSTGGYAIYGRAATSSGSGAAVRADGGPNNGVFASTTNATRLAVYGWSTSDLSYATAIEGQISSSTPGAWSAGVRGRNLGTAGAGVGVWGSHSGSGYGVYGTAVSGYGVVGATTATTGGTVGVYGSVVSDNWYAAGVEGHSPSGYGVAGSASDTVGVGVMGSAYGTGGVGVSAYRGGTATYALQATGDSFVEGSLEVTGTVTGVATSVIDHPLDPAGRSLRQAAVESSERLRIQSGTTTLDARGRATVNLPTWFDAASADARYALTAIGRPAPDLHVARELAGGSFEIAGGAAGQRVSWQVAAVRRDAWALANPLVVEQDKAETDQGRYHHPAAHGAGVASPIGAVRKPDPVD